NIHFSPRQNYDTPRVFFDASCSRFGLSAESQSFRQDEWAYVGCRLVGVEGSDYRAGSLELLVYWDNVGQDIEIGGVKTESTLVSLWPIRAQWAPGRISFKAGTNEVTLNYRLPARLYYGSVGLGVGPYSFTFTGDGVDVTNWVLMPTVYLSYFVTEAMRFVIFDATTVNKQIITDFGLYLNTEYIRTIDRRLALNLMVGFHAIGFRSQEQYYFLFGLPQGAEVIVTDFFKPGYNLSFGGFLYPEISGKAYYNTWLRWGSGRIFGEFNYISWSETINSQKFYSRSLGATIGFPLPFLRFL
ncbi:MAG: hypothetical protein AABZ06_09870, partial [Bdellovibrionota bacterium]